MTSSSNLLSEAAKAKASAAQAALDLIIDDTVVGLGTGSTAKKHHAKPLKIKCVATSKKTEKRALELDLPMISFLDIDYVDITIDGTDEIDGRMNLIKGGGGALLREKIVATASTRLVVIADESKKVERLGAFPLPIEVIPFGWLSTLRTLTGILVEFGLVNEPTQAQAETDTLPVKVRMNPDDTPFITDEGNFIFDLHLNKIDDPVNLSIVLNSLPGVVENGLFVDIADGVIFGKPDGTSEVFMSEYRDDESDDDE
jgi:ribose 5-phosphate isomerase A